MVGVGVGGWNYNDQLMDQVTDAGKGAAVFVSSDDEAEHIFADRFMNTMGVAARNVEVELDLPPGFEIVNFSGEEFSSVRSEIDPQHLAPNDAMVLHQVIQTCDTESMSGDSPIGVTVHWLDAQTFEPRELRTETTFAALLDGEVGLLRKGQAVFAYAEAAKAHRSGTDSEKETALAAAMTALGRAESDLPGDSDLAEIRSVLEAL